MPPEIQAECFTKRPAYPGAFVVKSYKMSKQAIRFLTVCFTHDRIAV